MAELSCDGGSSVNVYQPHRLLLASCKLRLAHAMVLMGSPSSSLSTNDRDALISSATMACRDGLQLIKDSAFSNPPLEAELNFHYGRSVSSCRMLPVWHSSLSLLGILCGLQSTDGGSFNIAPLLEATKMVSNQGVDYRSVEYMYMIVYMYLYTCTCT